MDHNPPSALPVDGPADRPADESASQRASGVLLHPTSLPGPDGIGDLGGGAIGFLDWLAEAGQSIWQILPINEPGFGDSPYAAASSFAGNELLISLESLAADLDVPQASAAMSGPVPGGAVDYALAARRKRAALRSVWAQVRSRNESGFADRLAGFAAAEQNRPWLEDWTLFAALKRELGGRPWWEWPAPLRRREGDALAEARERLRDEIGFGAFTQLVFWRQWRALRAAAARRGVRILGDLPIYVAPDSADVWAAQGLFDLDDGGRPRAVAGVPPDYFSESGQLWGNPLYRWDRMEETGFEWWIRRLSFALDQVDLLRLDHFRGFCAYWRVPAGAPDARAGEWVEAPGEKLFETVSRALGPLPLFAEDLGVITEDVVALRRRFDFPGMKVLQFAFDGPTSPHLPHHHEVDTLVYTGTHDNDTTEGWYRGAGPATRRRAADYLGLGAEGISRAMIRAALTSVARFAIVPAQDLLGLGSEARMNTPGRADGNWRWRLVAGELDGDCADWLRRVTEVSDRLGPRPSPSSQTSQPSPQAAASAPEETSPDVETGPALG